MRSPARGGSGISTASVCRHTAPSVVVTRSLPSGAFCTEAIWISSRSGEADVVGVSAASASARAAWWERRRGRCARRGDRAGRHSRAVLEAERAPLLFANPFPRSGGRHRAVRGRGMRAAQSPIRLAHSASRRSIPVPPELAWCRPARRIGTPATSDAVMRNLANLRSEHRTPISAAACASARILPGRRR